MNYHQQLLTKLAICSIFAITPTALNGCTKSPGPNLVMGAVLVGGSIAAYAFQQNAQTQKKAQPVSAASIPGSTATDEQGISEALGSIFGQKDQED